MNTKKWIGTMLAVCLSIACLTVTAFAGSSDMQSGDLTVEKPSQHDIYKKWAPIEVPDSTFVEAPSVTAPYATGKLSDAYLKSGVEFLNLMRYLAGLPEVQLDDELNDLAQHGAVLMAANDELSHFPTKPADMDDAFYEKGYQAAGESNLSMYSDSVGDLEEYMLVQAVLSCMDDTGSYSNMNSVGHRRWLLNPTLLNVGFGCAKANTTDGMHTYYMDSLVHDTSGAGCDYDFISWPASGEFPSLFFDPAAAWSVTLNPEKYMIPELDKVKVTLTHYSAIYAFDSTTGEPPADGVAEEPYMTVNTQGAGVISWEPAGENSYETKGNCIIFHPGTNNVDEYDGLYTVTITGIYDRQGNEQTLTYQVNFFDINGTAFHEFESQYIEPTCTRHGGNAWVCECGAGYFESTVAALGHDYTSELIKEPTCTEKGEERYTCQRCEYSYLGYVDTVPHVYDQKTVVPPTCSSQGYTVWSCVCGLKGSYGDYVDATGDHQYVESSRVEPTCVSQGSVYYMCANKDCRSSKVESLPETGHTYVDTVVPPRCMRDGYTQHDCTYCGHFYRDNWQDGLECDFENVVPVYVPDQGWRCHRGYCRRGCGNYWTASCVTDDMVQEASVLSFGKRGRVCVECGHLYEGELTLCRLSGADRCATAYAAADALKDLLGVKKFDNIIIASGSNFADALAGSYLAKVKGAPILLYMYKSEQQNLSYIANNLAPGGTVYILGGTAAVPARVDSQLKGYTVKRLAGDTRYDTNLKILEEAGVNGEEILVATGRNFADSLSASATGLPILLVDSNKSLSAAQQAYLSAHSDSDYTILGGTAAVSEKMASAIESATGKKPDRVYGERREDTSVLVAQRYFDAPQTALIAFSRNFPDGLCGGPVAYAAGAPLLLTRAGAESIAAEYIQAENIQAGAVLGGPAAVSHATTEKVFGQDFAEIK